LNRVSLCWHVMDGAGVTSRWQAWLTDEQFPAEVIHLVRFGFEIAVIEMRKDEIQYHQPRADVLDGMLAAIAQVLSAHRSIDWARKEVVDTPVAEKEPRGGMPLP